MFLRFAAATVARLAQEFPVVTLIGPRQSGKTTLARAAFPGKPYVSLETPNERAYAQEDPLAFLDRFPQGAVLDEAQHAPQLFSYLQTRVDLDGRMGLFVLTGSQNFGLLSSITQSLAGRTGIVHLLPFSLAELAVAGRHAPSLDAALFSGLYPPLHDRLLDPASWHAGYIATYLERDVRQMASVHNLDLFQRFLRLCAARTGQLLNLASLASDAGISPGTARNWLSILQASYIVFLLQPHHRNFGKRLVKTPKLYFHDTGLAAALLNIQGLDHMAVHPARPALFETLAVGECLKARFNRGLASNLYFWRDNIGNEIDLLIENGPRLDPVEIKSGRTISPDWFAGLRRWSSHAGREGGPPMLVYGGEDSHVRSGVKVAGWRELANPDCLVRE